MSYTDGMAAINLEMPDRIPRTEYSAEGHWVLISAVTGIDVNFKSSDEIKARASKKFIKAWNYDIIWNVLIHSAELGEFRTKMGHASYASGAVDYNDDIFCLFATTDEALRFDPFEKYGVIDKQKTITRFEEHYKAAAAYNPDAVNMTGTYITLMSGLIEIYGWDMLLSAAGEDPEGFGQVACRYTKWISQYFEALAEADVPVVMVHDDIVWTEGAFLHPDWYRKFLFPNYKKLFASLIESGKNILYTSDANYTEFIDDIADCGVNGFVLEPTTDMKYMAEKYGKTHVIIGNADTRVLLSGSKQQIYDEVKRCIDIGKGCPGYFMAVGNHIPSNTPVENALYYNEVYEKLSRR